jgi:hypothetical protein
MTRIASYRLTKTKLLLELLARRGGIRCLIFLVRLPKGAFQHHQIATDRQAGSPAAGQPIKCLAFFASIRPERSN